MTETVVMSRPGEQIVRQVLQPIRVFDFYRDKP